MAQATQISWTDLSWNPVHGCSKVGPGCAHCYAETLSRRYHHTPKPWTPANASENVLLKPHKLGEPLSNAKDWRGLGAAAAAAGKTDGKLVFVNSMSDLFHEQVPAEFIADVFAVMILARRHTFQILTKRAERQCELLNDHAFWWEVMHAMGERSGQPVSLMSVGLPRFKRIWLGVSIENRRYVHRADLLRQTPAAVRFISAEPLLGPLIGPETFNVETGRGLREVRGWPGDVEGAYRPSLDLTNIDWLIVGGESGKGHRPMDLQWARYLHEACACADCHGEGEREEGISQDSFGNWDTRTVRCGICEDGMSTAFFLKQLGGARPDTPWDEIPEDLRVREFPTVAA